MLVIDSTSNEYAIQYPDHVSEFEVHADLYFRLRLANPDCEIRGEVKSRGTHGLRKAKTACRFDLVAYKHKKAICIVEVKGGLVKHNTCMADTRQGCRYPTYGVPVVVCYGFEDIEAVVDYVAGLVGGAFG